MEKRESYQPTPPAEAKNIQPLQRGFDISKIDDQIKDAITNYGIKMKNAMDHGVPSVVLEHGNQFKITVNGQDWSGKGNLQFDQDTLKIERYGLRQDGFNNPNAPLRLKCTNLDGTVDDIVFEKKSIANSAETNPEAAKIDQFISNFRGSPKELFDDPAGKAGFDAIVKNWMGISNASVAKVKDLVRSYAEGLGAKVPDRMTLSVASSNGNPGLRIDGTEYVIFNGPDAAPTSNEKQPPKPAEIAEIVGNEKIRSLETGDGRKLKLIEKNPAPGEPMDRNYNYKALIVDGQRYNIVPDSVSRMRDGGTTNSTFEANGKRISLHQPTPFSNEKPSIRSL